MHFAFRGEKMGKRYKISTLILILIVAMFFVSCDVVSFLKDNFIDDINKMPNLSSQTIYYWYDADGTLLHEEQLNENVDADYYPLPADNDKWDYIEWIDGENNNEFTACRIPQNSYFVGNVFQIVVKDLGGTPIATGSAFVFDEYGWFITNAHVMEGAYYAQAIFNIENSSTGESFRYFDINSGIYYHLDKDIYIGKIDNYLSIKSYYREFPFNLDYEVGDKTYSVGYPHSSTDLMINEGEITENWSDLYEKLYSGNSYICSSSYIAPGSSGGILVNDNLEVIGITTLGWTDRNNEFISGAAISAFNYSNLLKTTGTSKLLTLQDRFHSEEKAFIGYFNEAKNHEKTGRSERVELDDGTIAYVYEWTEEDAADDGTPLISAKTFTIGSDGFIYYTEEFYWGVGDRRTQSFYGIYDHKKGFANFTFEFKYQWADGSYYTIVSDDINYSSNISLTLNKYNSNSYKCDVTQENIDYAKRNFNVIYEWLVHDIARFK